ncbi:MAG TPA: hypothetical protein VFF85_14775, partial [Microbacterium sp.]|nr:hypothetical protein [Microbacterium sp.]
MRRRRRLRPVDRVGGPAQTEVIVARHQRRSTVSTTPLPPVVDAATWQRELDALRVREKAATRELD